MAPARSVRCPRPSCARSTTAHGSMPPRRQPEVAALAADPENSALTTLSDLIGLAVDSGREVALVLETKHPTRFVGAVERAVAELLDEHGIGGRPGTGRPWATVMSFSTLAVRRFARLRPDILVVQLVDAGRHTGMCSRRRTRKPRPGSTSRSCAARPSLSMSSERWAVRCTCGPSTPTRTSHCASTLGSTRSSPTDLVRSGDGPGSRGRGLAPPVGLPGARRGVPQADPLPGGWHVGRSRAA